ncbi:MAG: hypothetical protein A3F40_03450 [Chlamydiae bacterium RIFCSPHIGHO2_12_FULL_27_8]|nr:MAG: hypothetical protein A3F40_03450 [Chlamydiae bacterium RIFCSPHIGHO2_12_FULL_27_8]OGN66618.1 MAG: hypothetical protein A2888_02430 [Chlamydiae bacterium RIFCSPLOWO2_01_FULL_28_7]
MIYIKAQIGPPNIGEPEGRFTVQYFDEKGNLTIRSGGTRAWRCNNPGNLQASPYSMSKQRHSIGKVREGKNEYAVYPDYETGHLALVVMLRGTVYSPLSLREAMKKYDFNNPMYIDEIVKITKLDPERTIKSLSDHEFEIFWKAIEKVEKWIVGREDFIEKWYITSVHKKHGVITQCLIKKNENSLWVSKEEAVQLAIDGRLHVTLVHLKTGKVYLRPEFGHKPFEKVS